MKQICAIAVFVFGFVWLLLPMKRLFKAHPRLFRVAEYFIFGVYVLANMGQTVLFRKVNLNLKNYFIPFRTHYLAIRQFISQATNHYMWNLWYTQEIVLNILLYVPLGYLLPFLWDGLRTRKEAGKHSRWALRHGMSQYIPMISGKVVGIGAICTLATELTQMMLHIGAFQVDDLINNTLGCVIGCVLYEWVVRVDKRVKIKK